MPKGLLPQSLPESYTGETKELYSVLLLIGKRNRSYGRTQFCYQKKQSGH